MLDHLSLARPRQLAIALGIALASALPITAARAETHSNTQAPLPSNLYLADVNGDGRADLLQVADNKLFAFNADSAGTPILHKYFDQNVSRVMTGDFTTSGREHGKDQVCGIFADASFACYAISDDGTDLWWWFTQPSMIAADEQAIVGDFDGDGADDILVYKPSTGEIRAYTRMTTGIFQPMPNFSLGNLATADRLNKKLLAGEFGQTAPRSDLLVVDPATGQVSRYDSVTDATGHRTFWWAFTTASHTLSANDDVLVARVENSALDSIVLRNRVTGALQLKRAEYASGGLAAVSGVSPGQLPITADSGRLAFARTASFATEPGGTLREDALFFDLSTGQVSKYDARWDGSHLTYWWAYTKKSPALNSGWAGVTHDAWTVVLCTFSDVVGLPQGTTFWHSQFSSGTGGVADYFWDMSYGSRDLYGTRIIGPYAMGARVADVATSRAAAAQDCKDAATANGASVPAAKVIFYVNSPVDDGNSGSVVTADPSLNSPTALGHEMSHVYGVNDSVDDRHNWYGDPYDVMSAMAAYCFAGSSSLASSDNACYSPATNTWARVANTAAGPGLDVGNRIAEGLLSAGRVRLLTPGSTRQSVSLDLTGLDRPEASATLDGGVQAIRIPIAAGALPECVPGNTCSTTGNYYTIELREASRWDRAFPQSAVLVHRVAVTNDKTQTFLMTSPRTLFMAGATYADGTVSIHVNSLDAARGVASLGITY